MITQDRTDVLEQALDAFALGIFVVTRDGTIVFMNRHAAALGERADALQIKFGRLTAKDKCNASDLAAALNRCLAPSWSHVPPPQITLALMQDNSTGLIATVLRHGRQRGATERGPTTDLAMVIVKDPGMAPHLPAEAFGRLYSLTQAELRVATALVSGVTPQVAATSLGISCNTVKTHLQRIFEKTSTSRQSDLIALMMRTAPPLFA